MWCVWFVYRWWHKLLSLSANRPRTQSTENAGLHSLRLKVLLPRSRENISRRRRLPPFAWKKIERKRWICFTWTNHRTTASAMSRLGYRALEDGYVRHPHLVKKVVLRFVVDEVTKRTLTSRLNLANASLRDVRKNVNHPDLLKWCANNALVGCLKADATEGPRRDYKNNVCKTKYSGWHTKMLDAIFS